MTHGLPLSPPVDSADASVDAAELVSPPSAAASAESPAPPPHATSAKAIIKVRISVVILLDLFMRRLPFHRLMDALMAQHGD